MSNYFHILPFIEKNFGALLTKLNSLNHGFHSIRNEIFLFKLNIECVLARNLKERKNRFEGISKGTCIVKVREMVSGIPFLLIYF